VSTVIIPQANLGSAYTHIPRRLDRRECFWVKRTLQHVWRIADIKRRPLHVAIGSIADDGITPRQFAPTN
jgi:hypothetical protein